MTAFLLTVGHLAADGAEALARYAQGVFPLLEAAGGKVAERLRPTEVAVGEDVRPPDLVAVLRFDSADAVRAFLDSAAYRRLERHRDRAFSQVRSYVAESL